MKQYTIRHHHKECEPRDYTGTLEELCDRVFGYTLECGHSWNHKIPRYPKTGRSLEKALNNSANECRRYYDWYELVG